MSKYIVNVEVGNMPRTEAEEYVKRLEAKFLDFLGGAGQGLFVPCRNGVPAISVYRLEDAPVIPNSPPIPTHG
jgi:hypothetical protein